MNIVWKDQVDKKYDVYVERTEPYKGELIIKEGDKELTRKPVTMVYDAKFGPDAADVYEWQNICTNFIDDELNKSI